MVLYYFDSSALVKRYISERGTAWVLGITDPGAGNIIFVARITAVEVVSAIMRAAWADSITSADALVPRPIFGTITSINIGQWRSLLGSLRGQWH